MKPLRRSAIVAFVLAATTVVGSSAWALTGGGTAPGGPLSRSIRPACNGYNMDGTVNTSPGADRPGCIDRSANALHRPSEQRPHD